MNSLIKTIILLGAAATLFGMTACHTVPPPDTTTVVVLNTVMHEDPIWQINKIKDVALAIRSNGSYKWSRGEIENIPEDVRAAIVAFSLEIIESWDGK